MKPVRPPNLLSKQSVKTNSMLYHSNIPITFMYTNAIDNVYLNTNYMSFKSTQILIYYIQPHIIHAMCIDIGIYFVHHVLYA